MIVDLPPWRELFDREPDEAVVAARDWIQAATGTGVLSVDVDISDWLWVPVAIPLDNGRMAVQVIDPVWLDAAVEAKQRGEVIEHPSGEVRLEMEQTDDGWRCIGPVGRPFSVREDPC